MIVPPRKWAMPPPSPPRFKIVCGKLCGCVQRQIIALIKQFAPIGGDTPEFRVDNNILQYKLLSQTTWTDLIDLSTLMATSITATANAVTIPSTEPAAASVEVTE